jgi:hypothetical protein
MFELEMAAGKKKRWSTGRVIKAGWVWPRAKGNRPFTHSLSLTLSLITSPVVIFPKAETYAVGEIGTRGQWLYLAGQLGKRNKSVTGDHAKIKPSATRSLTSHWPGRERDDVKEIEERCVVKSISRCTA